MRHSIKRDHIDLVYAYGGALISLLIFLALSVPIDTSKFGVVLPLSKPAEKDIYQSSAFDTVDVKAKAYVVYDIVDKRVIASKNIEEPLPIASLTKIMMATTALTHYGKDASITIHPESIEDGYDLGLKKGQVWKLGELLKYTLVFSSNDGAHAIADGLGTTRKQFVDLMNADSALLGLSFTFTDPAGLDVGDKIGGKGTVLDVAKILSIAHRDHPEIMEATTHSRLTVPAGRELVIGIPNTNQEIEHVFGAEASKTGYTDSAGGNLGIIVDVTLGHPVAIVVLGSTREERFSDVASLYQALLQALRGGDDAKKSN